MRASLFGVLAVVALGYLALCAALWWFQRSLLYIPPPARGTPLVTLEVPGARLVLSVREKAGDKALLYFGGNAEDVSMSLPELETAFPDHALYLLYYRGYAGSTGVPSEAALHEDSLALFDLVQKKHPAITAMGRSLGSGVAIRLASERPVERLLLVTPYYSIVDIAARHFRFFPVRWLMTDRFESWRYVPSIRVPVTIVAAGHDEIIPAWSSEQLRDAFDPALVRYEVLRGAGHNDISFHPDYIPALTRLP